MGIPQHPFSELRSWTHLPSPPAPSLSPLDPAQALPEKSLDCLTPSGYLLPRRPSLSLNELICERLTYNAQVRGRWYSYYDYYHPAFLLSAFCRGQQSPFFLPVPFLSILQTCIKILPGVKLQTSCSIYRAHTWPLPAQSSLPSKGDREETDIPMQGGKSIDGGSRPLIGAQRRGV